MTKCNELVLIFDEKTKLLKRQIGTYKKLIIDNGTLLSYHEVGKKRLIIDNTIKFGYVFEFYFTGNKALINLLQTGIKIDENILASILDETKEQKC